MNPSAHPGARNLRAQPQPSPMPSPTNCGGTTTTCMTSVALRQTHAATIAASVGLLLQKFAGGVIDMARLHAADVRRFIARQLGDSPRILPLRKSQPPLRSYLRYRTICGDSVAGLSAVISSPVQWNLAVLPRALKPDEVQRSARRTPLWTQAPARLCHRPLRTGHGLRAGEIANPSIDDIDWRSARSR